MQYHAIPCNIIEDHQIPSNTIQYHWIPSSTFENHWIPCTIPANIFKATKVGHLRPHQIFYWTQRPTSWPPYQKYHKIPCNTWVRSDVCNWWWWWQWWLWKAKDQGAKIKDQKDQKENLCILAWMLNSIYICIQYQNLKRWPADGW